MDKMERRIETLKSELEDYCFEDGDVNYVALRLRNIRKELVKEDKVFEMQNLCKVIDISKYTFVNLESGKKGADYRSIIKLIHLYALQGYNPFWVLTKDNFFLEKRNEDKSIIFNKSTVEMAVSRFNESMKSSIDIQKEALEKLKNDIVS